MTYTLGPRFGVDEVELGDIVTFIVPDEATKTGKVCRIMENFSTTRRRIFLDERNYALNGYPDSVTDCFLNLPTPEPDKIRHGEEATAFDNFKKVPVGSVFGVDLVGPDSHIYVKVGLNTWRFIDVTGIKYTSFDIHEMDDAGAFNNLWEPEGKTTFSQDPDTLNWSQDWTNDEA